MSLYKGENLIAGSLTVPYNWSGTKAEYEALETIDENWVYYVTDDVSVGLDLLDTIYPVGSLYLTTASTCPLATLGIGTWILEAADRVLQGAGSRGSVGTTVDESLPNITGKTLTGGWDNYYNTLNNTPSGAFVSTPNNAEEMRLNGGSSGTIGVSGGTFDASRSSSIYQDNAPVQQDAYLINVFRRIA